MLSPEDVQSLLDGSAFTTPTREFTVGADELARGLRSDFEATLSLRVEPLSYVWGLDRGLPLHRFYLEQFLSEFGVDQVLVRAYGNSLTAAGEIRGLVPEKLKLI